MAKAKKLPSGSWNVVVFAGFDKDGRKTALSLDFYSNNAVLFGTESEGFEPNKPTKNT